MQQEQQQPEGAPAPIEQQPEAQEAVPQQAADEMVSKADLERALADLHKYKAQVKELTASASANNEKLLREGKRWEELAELKAREAEEARNELAKAREAIVNDKKFSAVRDAALKAGLRPEAIADLELVALDKVDVETTSMGRVNVLGVDSLISNIKLSRPHWFGGGKTNVAGAVPNISSPGGLVTKEEVIKLSLEASKSGDYTAYQQKLKQYQKQQKGV